MTDQEYRRAMEWMLQLFGQRFADACEREDFAAAEECVGIVVRRQLALAAKL